MSEWGIGRRASVEDIRILEVAGPWKTKSAAELTVLFNLPQEVLQSTFLRYDDVELSKIPEDIRGLRAYTVRGVASGSKGANEWHKLRHELVFALTGSFRWIFKDSSGAEKNLIINSKRGVWVRPCILHAYESLEKDSSLLVITNTLFVPDNPATHDTYSAELFNELVNS